MTADNVVHVVDDPDPASATARSRATGAKRQPRKGGGRAKAGRTTTVTSTPTPGEFADDREIAHPDERPLTARDRWDAALTDYLTRQPRVPDASTWAEDQRRNGGDAPHAVAVTVAQAEPTARTHVVMPLARFVALLREATTPAEPTV